MLSQLTIKNFGLIDSLSIDFCESLNVFTGETGAGKSILIGALRFALGEKISLSQVHDPDKPCIVEAVFELSDKLLKESSVFSEYLTEDEPVLIVSRAYLPGGRNRNKVNGFTVTTVRLRTIGNFLIDFHGPHSHQMLFSETSHIDILDRLSDLDVLKREYDQKYDEYAKSQKQINELRALSEHSEREQDILAVQIKELEQVPLDAAKYEEIVQESARVNNMEKLYESANQLNGFFEDEQVGISGIVSQAFAPMRDLNDIDESTVELAKTLERIQENCSEMIAAISNYLNNLSFEQDRATEINRQCDIYYEILRKYGPGLEDALKFYNDAKQKYDLLINLEHNDSELKRKTEAVFKDLSKIADKLSLKRGKSANILKETIENELKELGIVHVQFECRIGKSEINRKGKDNVVFYISPNAGEDLKPLAEIVSSGEAARVMLALKKALTKVDPIPVLIFDEIDAQIGGRLGTITGKKLKELSDDRQVILITHLPQIASFGEYHFKVSKEVKDSRTVTSVNLLEKDMRIKELAKMMSGDMESQIAVKHAQDMLVRAE